ncbi:MAG TPA: hypothetical protein VMZ31_16845 [Phycisphaerae bacterium]|nr:hypothetical protein [Phycisphaerae bacterium]
MSNRVTQPLGNGAITVDGEYTDVLEVPLQGQHSEMELQLSSAAASAALTSFRMVAKAHEDGEWIPRWADDDWTSGAIEDIKAVTAEDAADAIPKTLAAEVDIGIRLLLGPLWAVKFQAKTAGADATISMLGTAALGGGG